MSNKLTLRLTASADGDVLNLVLASSDGTAITRQEFVDAILEYTLLLSEDQTAPEASSESYS